MSHIVIHDDKDNITQYRQFEDVQAAAAYLEALHNHDGITGARLYALDEVAFAVRSYVKVEIGVASPVAPAVAVESGPFAPNDAVPSEPASQVDVAGHDDVAGDDDVSGHDEHGHDEHDPVPYHDSSLASMEAFAPTTGPELVDESIGASEVRRGLFGR
jgi:hypothetical protein